mmetsp:Transcript_121494/g.355102  ORF Transcript_121494/g.355102 Transcript_121494/m.355102 type:complete len:200 (-) Transcript_121494:154-753(-)
MVPRSVALVQGSVVRTALPRRWACVLVYAELLHLARVHHASHVPVRARLEEEGRVGHGHAVQGQPHRHCSIGCQRRRPEVCVPGCGVMTRFLPKEAVLVEPHARHAQQRRGRRGERGREGKLARRGVPPVQVEHLQERRRLAWPTSITASPILLLWFPLLGRGVHGSFSGRAPDAGQVGALELLCVLLCSLPLSLRDGS